ncbi:ABC transporter ATP-binding protein [Eisenbergiella porci]|uniref:ABC transporter ATP-binding protein n=1 Tax=Eisenbergiella porci TaxID=2652274 RepID=A0A6N7WBI0_9FIRM|nr:ABC transporter ATP-binding protein [Eisenbergiella porci]MDY5529164.1 ABC transporter ATP-binding protein [Eisenbergiella porci]MSS87837.1 ABC transporter ATP-binding protein [Eisenbergiella porci]
MFNKFNYIFNRKEKRKLLLLLVIIIIGSFLELLGVAAFMPFISVLMDTNIIYENKILLYFYRITNFGNIEYFLAFLALLICCVYILKNIYLSFMQNMILNFAYNMRMNLATNLLATYIAEPYTFHLTKNIADMQRCLQIDANQFMLLMNATLQLIAEIMVCIALGIYLFDTSHSITIAIAVLLIGCLGLFYLISKKISQKLGRQNQRYNSKLIQWVNQALGGIKEVKVLERESFFINSYKENYKKLIKGAKNNEMLATIPKYIVETVCICGMLLAVVGKMFFGRREIVDFIPQLSVFAVAAFRLLPSVGKINSYINGIMYGLPSLDLIYHDLKEVENNNRIIKKDVKKTDKFFIKEKICLVNVRYRYPNTDIDVLKKINLEIGKGKTVALIGSSGAGKTTLADIILGLLQPTEGRIMVDECDIFDNISLWHKSIGYIPQNIYLSDDTIRNNIAFGVEENEINDSAVEGALRKAQLYDFVQNLAEGINTFVGDRGVRLSGGQRQRIGIARALYHEPDILILDEATSALDNETEQAVMGAIEKLQGVKTMIIIAHRLTTIKKADEIYEVVNGELVKRNLKDIF